MSKHRKMVNGMFVGIWPFEHRRTQELFGKSEAGFYRLLDLASAVGAKAAAIRTSRDLTPEGQRKELWKLAENNVAELKAGAVAMNAAQTEAATKRSKLTFAKGDRTDVVGAMVRAELRREIRSMEPAKRNAMLVMGAADPEIALAIMEAPAILSGVTEEQRQRLQGQAVLAQHPEAGQEIADLEEASAAVARALRAATRTIEKETGVGAIELSQLMGEPGLRERLRAILPSDDGDPPAAAA